MDELFIFSGLRTPFGSPAGKRTLAELIVSYIPEHKIFVEPFIGGGAVLFRKKPSESEVINDKDKEIAFAWKYIQGLNEEKIAKLKKFDWVSAHQKWKKELQRKTFSSPEDRVYNYIYSLEGSFSLNRSTYRWSGKGKSMIPDFGKWGRARDRIKGAKIFSQDYEPIVRQFDSKQTLFYLDPPYPKQWGGPKKDLNFDLKRLRKVLDGVKGKFILSVDASPENRAIYKGYTFKTINRLTLYPRSEQQKDPKHRPLHKEFLIFNFEPKRSDVWVAEEINLPPEDENWPEFVWVSDFIVQTGSSVYGKHDPHDVDLIPKWDLPEDVFTKLDRIFKQKYPDKRIEWHLPSERGANWDYVPRYDLVLRPVKNPKVVKIREPQFKKQLHLQEIRAASPEIKAEAEQSKKEDKIKMFRFYYPFKTALSMEAYRKAEVYNVEQVIEYIKKVASRDGKDWVPFSAQKKYDGLRLILMKSADKVRIYTEDGNVVTERFPGTVKELLAIKIDEFIIEAEAELWNGDLHLPREDAAGYVHEKGEADDSNLISNCFDCLYISGKDIHGIPSNERFENLKSLNFKQSTLGVPDTEKSQLNLSPTLRIEKEEDVKTALTQLSESPYSEGAMLKLDLEYPLSGMGSQMVKYKKYAEIHAIVWKVNSTKVKTIFNYELALTFNPQDKVQEQTIVDVKGEKYSSIGRSYNTDVRCKIGDVISVKFHTINLYEKDGNFRLHIYEPIFFEKREEREEPDSFDTAIQVGEDSGLLQKKAAGAETFIENLETYNPVKVDRSEVLRDDWRILCAWYSTILSGGEMKYSKMLIEEKAGELLKEIFRRGIAKFDLAEQKKPAQKLFKIAALKATKQRGVFLVEPHAEWLASGKKEIVVKARAFEGMLDKPLILVSKGKAWGIVKLK